MAKRRDRLIRPKKHDTYKLRAKPKDAVACDDCGVTYHGGKWSWKGPPLCNVRHSVCPACRRIRDRYPAGEIRLKGDFDRDTVIRLMRHVEEREKSEHPLERIMDVRVSDEGVLVTTTGLHVARKIATALKRQFHDNVKIRYDEEGNLVHVAWVG